MGRIHVLSENVANKIAAGEVVERPSSVVKELLENSLDAGATRIRVQVEAGGKKLMQVTDNGSGMVRDDAMLAFERHATSKIKNAEDLLTISTLGFRGEGLPSIASVSRLTLETCAADEPAGSLIEIAGGKFLKVEEAGLPKGTSVTVKDLFFNTPARKKFLKAESTELSHIASLVTHYALAHPEKHFELHSATNAILVATPVKTHAERIYQVFGKDTLDQLLPVAAEADLERVGLPEPPPWRRDEDYEKPLPGKIRVHGFVSKPEIQKLNRNSIFIFVNNRLIRDRLVQHALTEAYRNILPPTVFPVVLLFLEMPSEEVDANVHPSKTEVRFRQQAFIHDFVRDTVRATLMRARPVPQFTREISAQPSAGQALTPGAMNIHPVASDKSGAAPGVAPSLDGFVLQAPMVTEVSGRLAFQGGEDVGGNAAVAVPRIDHAAIVRALSSTLAPYPADRGASVGKQPNGAAGDTCAGVVSNGDEDSGVVDLTSLGTLKALGQIRESFILAVNYEGLWIIDQHVAHERVLFEKILAERETEKLQGQRLLMPLIVELTPGQQAIFTEISEELRTNGFEVEPFGTRTIAVKTAPAGVNAPEIEKMLFELLEQFEREQQTENLDRVRHRIAASIACHAAIKVNMPLEQNKMDWLLQELAKTDYPMTCPHGRPVVLRYSLKDIQKAFKRI
ncbi:MAG: mismatch repair protein MutL [Acidobacteriales bacterium]|nr:mismatch repair protein MutL [Terriglobales bacterium]